MSLKIFLLKVFMFVFVLSSCSSLTISNRKKIYGTMTLGFAVWRIQEKKIKKRKGLNLSHRGGINSKKSSHHGIIELKASFSSHHGGINRPKNPTVG